LLEGTVSIFRAAFAVLNILEKELLECQEFSEVYTVLNCQPFEVVNNPYIIILHIKKFMHIKENTIKQLRKEYRPEIIAEQCRIWKVNSQSKCPSEYESIQCRRIKLLHKMPLLEEYIHNKNQGDNSHENILDLNHCKPSIFIQYR
jgi:hypothetical protein